MRTDEATSVTITLPQSVWQAVEDAIAEGAQVDRDLYTAWLVLRGEAEEDA